MEVERAAGDGDASGVAVADGLSVGLVVSDPGQPTARNSLRKSATIRSASARSPAGRVLEIRERWYSGRLDTGMSVMESTRLNGSGPMLWDTPLKIATWFS